MPDVNPFKNVEGNCFISNYKPAEGREDTKKDIKIDIVNGEANIDKQSRKNLKNLNEKYSSIYDALKKYNDGNKLEKEDLAHADELVGQFNITKVLKDLNAGVVRFIFGDNTQLRIDFETPEEAQEKKNQEAQAKVDEFNRKFNGKYTATRSGGQITITVTKETAADRFVYDLNVDPAVFFENNGQYKVTGANEILYNGAESSSTELAWKNTPKIQAGATIILPFEVLD